MGCLATKLLFPKPECKYKSDDPGIFWLPLVDAPSQKASKKDPVLMPCRLIECSTPTDKVIIYFHGNAEDLYYSEMFLRPLVESCMVVIP